MSYIRCAAVSLVILFCAAAISWADAVVSAKTPSADVNAPTSIDVGEIVKGRLANSNETGKYHYWSVNLPPGKYKVVLDVRRADDDPINNIGGILEWFSTDGVKQDQILSINETDNRFRSIARFEIRKPLRAIIRYGNWFTVSDYWLGVFPSEALVVNPFFVRTPEVRSLAVGKPVTAVLDGSRPYVRDAFYHTHLASGDYKILVEFRRADGNPQGSVGGVVRALGPEGEASKQVLSVNTVAMSGKQTTKLSLADDADIIFLCRPSYFVSPATNQSVTLDIELWRDQ